MTAIVSEITGVIDKLHIAKSESTEFEGFVKVLAECTSKCTKAIVTLKRRKLVPASAIDEVSRH